MRLTQALCKQHIGFMFKKHWIFQGKRKLVPEKLEVLKTENIKVLDANEYTYNKKKPKPYKAIGMYDTPAPLDKYHPDWKETPCHIHTEINAILEGLRQSQILTKSVIAEGLPEALEEAALIAQPPEVHDQVKRAVFTANVFDSTQKKLPKIKDPDRPAVNFPRIYGIDDIRRSEITTSRLVSILEKNCNHLAKERFSAPDSNLVTSFQKDGDLIQFQLKSDILITSAKALGPVLSDVESLNTIILPDLYPVHHIISIPQKNFYDIEDYYPITSNVKVSHPHTSFLHYNMTQVKNLHGTPVTEDQILARSLLHSFTLASAYAKTLYGTDVTVLPTPVTVQCVQTDGQNFYIGVLQLNTLDVNGTEGTRNIWYKSPTIRLFDKCEYSKAIPVLEGYNPKVYQYLHALYNNQ